MTIEFLSSESLDKQTIKLVENSLIGTKFGYWIVLSEKFYKNRAYYVKTQCICGKKCNTRFNTLKYGKSKSCGCQSSKHNINKYIGKKIGFWTIIRSETSEERQKRLKTNRKGNQYVFAKCKCGTEQFLRLSTLREESSKSCGCSYIHKNLVDQKSGRLVVKEELPDSDNGHRMLKVKCDCGTVTTVRRSTFVRKGVRSCGCLANETRAKNIKKAWKSIRIQDREKKIIMDIISSYKSRARRRKPSLVFELTYDDVRQLIFQNCYYCGGTPDKEKKDEISDFVLYWNGIDRFDNNKGYTKDNVVSCCEICNRAKYHLSYDQFRAHIKKIYENLFAGEVEKRR